MKEKIGIEDRIYGKEEIKDKVLIDLINSESIQRLKDISQLGMAKEYSHVGWFSRFEHSLGTMILLNRLNASLDEQIAGLIHDSNHTTFSHVIDWVLGDPTKEDHQDKTYESFIKNSEISEILEKHSFNCDFILNYKNFRLLERELPSLCVDRIDYCLREMSMIKEKSSLVKKIINDLSVKDNQIVFKNKEIAELFGKEYSERQKLNWGSDQTRAGYVILANILRNALDKKIINLDDFKGTETPLLNKLYLSKDKFILNNLNLLKKGFTTEEDDGGIELKTKFRYIDPEVSLNGFYKKLSEISEDYLKIIKTEKKTSTIFKKVRIISN
jgi:hypothetical protein